MASNSRKAALNLTRFNRNPSGFS